MKQILFFIILILTTSGGFAQITIAQINSDSDVISFIKQENYSKDAPQWNHFYLTDGTEWNNYYNLSNQQVDSIKQNVKTLQWAKVDLNYDEIPDLIVSGYIADTPKDWRAASFKLLIFLSETVDSISKSQNLSSSHFDEYAELNLTNDASDEFPAYFSGLHINDTNYLQFFQWRPDKITPGFNLPLKIDTLYYNKWMGSLVNISSHLDTRQIKKINYFVKYNDQHINSKLSIEDTLDDNHMNLILTFKQPKFLKHSNRKTKMQLIGYYKTRTPVEGWANIEELVRSLPLNKDSTVYYNNNDDNSLPLKTVIYYKDGSKKTIIDYNGNVSFSLTALYRKFEDIKMLMPIFLLDTSNNY